MLLFVNMIMYNLRRVREPPQISSPFQTALLYLVLAPLRRGILVSKRETTLSGGLVVFSFLRIVVDFIITNDYY